MNLQPIKEGHWNCVSTAITLNSLAQSKGYTSQEDLWIRGHYNSGPYCTRTLVWDELIQQKEQRICLRIRIASAKEGKEGLWRKVPKVEYEQIGSGRRKVTGLLIKGASGKLEKFCKDFWEMELGKWYNFRSLSRHVGSLMLF